MRNRYILSFSAAAVLWLSNASAEETDTGAGDLDLVKLLNVQVSTATKTAESLDEAPAVITVVTRDDIHRWGYRNLEEVLNRCVGFFSVDDHVQPNLAVRGISGGLGAESGAIKVMIDSRSVAYRTTSGNWMGAELIPLESIRQIEIIRGPASALYGADAFLGVVNIITEAPNEARPIRVRTLTGFTGGNFSEQAEVVANGKIGKVDYLLGAVGEYGSRSGLRMPAESPSPNIPATTGERRTANNLDRRSLGLQARVGYQAADGSHAIVSAYFSGFERGGDFAPWAQLTNGTDAEGRTQGTVISQGQVRLNADLLFHATDFLDWSLQTTYFHGQVLPADRIEFGSELWYARRRGSYSGADSIVELRLIPTRRFNVVGGIEGMYDRENLRAPEQINRADDQPVASGNWGTTVNFVNIGAFVSSNAWVVDKYLKLTGGLRYDHHSTYGSQFTGRAGITSRLSDTVVMKLLYGSAFKAPSPYLLYAAPMGPGDVKGNVNLKPQKIQTAEYQVSYKPSQFFGLTSGVSYSWLFDKAEFSPQDINQVAHNAARQRTFSWETRADFKHYEDVTSYASFELVQSVRELGEIGYAAELVGDDASVYPPYIARAGATMALPSPIQVPLIAGAEAMLVGPRRAADASVLAAGKRFDLDAYATVNAFLATRDLYLIRGHETVIALRAYNLLGQTGPNPGFSGFEYPLAPREVLLELRHTY
jgi:outer membrane receptor for ferrienterochelin and colicins